jgi:transposase
MGGPEILSAAPEGAAEGDLINQSEYGAIRMLWERGRSKKAIARELRLDIKTVRKWIRHSWRPREKGKRVRELDSFAEFLKARAPEVGFNGVVLMREVSAQGYGGCYSALSNYIAPWRKQWRGEPEPTVRFETSPGEQAQVDWGSTKVWLGEQQVRIHIFTMVLGYSRRLFARAYRWERLDCLLDGHEKAFSHFGGRTETILYDNPRTIVQEKNEESGEVIWNRTFKDRMDFYGVKVKLCRYYRAQTKGKVESSVKYIKGNALAGQRFRDLEDLNAYLVSWCVSVADQRVHGTTHEKPAERFLREKEELLAVDLRPVPPRERLETRIVTREACVAVDTNFYPVPQEWIGRQVTVHILPEQVIVRFEESAPVRHARLEGRHQVPPSWSSPARAIEHERRPSPVGPPRFDPGSLLRLGEVESRPLALYEELSAEVMS